MPSLNSAAIKYGFSFDNKVGIFQKEFEGWSDEFSQYAKNSMDLIVVWLPMIATCQKSLLSDPVEGILIDFLSVFG